MSASAPNCVNIAFIPPFGGIFSSCYFFPFFSIIDLFRVTSSLCALIIKAVVLMGVISYGTVACRT
ncbi:hypothetical protein EWI30_15885 [Enterobacter cloacae]|nr:hypothetical protein EWI30_15885 [Enterobacter cloacae]